MELDCPERSTIGFRASLDVLTPENLRYVNFHAQDRFVGGIACKSAGEVTFAASFPLHGIECGRRFTLDLEMVPEPGKFFDIQQTHYVLQHLTCSQAL